MEARHSTGSARLRRRPSPCSTLRAPRPRTRSPIDVSLPDRGARCLMLEPRPAAVTAAALPSRPRSTGGSRSARRRAGDSDAWRHRMVADHRSRAALRRVLGGSGRRRLGAGQPAEHRLRRHPAAGRHGAGLGTRPGRGAHHPAVPATAGGVSRWACRRHAGRRHRGAGDALRESRGARGDRAPRRCAATSCSSTSAWSAPAMVAAMGPAVQKRVRGPSVASERGAVAMVIRSVGTSGERFAHTGTTRSRTACGRSRRSRWPVRMPTCSLTSWRHRARRVAAGVLLGADAAAGALGQRHRRHSRRGPPG
jgi:hypothetical protein